ncbi:reverse transcriptase domain-containing protein [Tanacetum coccineum]
MLNTNTNLQTKTSNALHNAIMEASGKDRPPMLAPARRANSIHRRLWVLKAHDGKSQASISDLEVAFRKSTCYIRDLKGNDLITGSRGIDLYTITLQDTSTPNPNCLMAKATLSQAWLWHCRLSHLNFDTINLLSKNDIVIGLPKLKFVKDHLCSSCELGKAKRKSFHTKTTPSSKRRLQLLHMDLCGPMWVENLFKEDFMLKLEQFELTKACDRFNDLLRSCPHHGISELHQLYTFYNALNSNDQDSLNSTVGGNFLDKMPCDCLRIIKRKSKVCNSRNKPVVAKVSASSSTPGISPDVVELKDMVKALLLDKKNQNQAPAPVKAVEESCVTCGGAHSYRNCPATDGNVYRDNIQEYVSQAAAANFNQGNTGYRASIANQIRPSDFPLVQQNQANDAVMRNMQDQNQMTNLTDMLSKFMNANTASTSGSGTLPSNTITNPKVDLKGITTRSGVAYQGPTIPTTSSSPPKVVERETEVTKDTVPPTNNGSTKDVQPPMVQVQTQVPNSEPVVAPVSALMPNLKPSIPYPSRRNDERRREKANDQIEKFYEIFKDLSFEISLTNALILMPKFASTLKALIENKEN